MAGLLRRRAGRSRERGRFKHRQNLLREQPETALGNLIGRAAEAKGDVQLEIAEQFVARLEAAQNLVGRAPARGLHEAVDRSLQPGLTRDLGLLLIGIVTFDGPDGWNFIGRTIDTIALPPGGTRLIPVRISIPKNTLGGISFVVGAELFGRDLYNYANSYISIQRKSRWDMRLNTSQVYVSDIRPSGDFSSP